MEKIDIKVGVDPTMLLDKVNEIVDWINEHEKYVQPLEKAWKEAVEQVLKQAKEKQGV